jgi:hypothetical protein
VAISLGEGEKVIPRIVIEGETLFLIDFIQFRYRNNSPSLHYLYLAAMDERQRIASKFDVHISIISSDMGTGEFTQLPSCDEDDCSAKDPRLFDPSNQSLNGPLGPLSSFRCFEFGVACDRQGQTVRSGGELKNCQPVSEGYLINPAKIISWLKELRPPGKIFFANISGTVPSTLRVELNSTDPELAPSCSSSQGVVVPAVRLKAVSDAFGEAGMMSDICTSDLENTLSTIATRILNINIFRSCR